MVKKVIKSICALMAIVLIGMVCYACAVISDTSDPNYELEMSEIKAYFKKTVYLDYAPEYDKISEIQIYSLAEMQNCDKYRDGNAIFNTKDHIKSITECLNSIKLVEASYDDLPNKSADCSIRYYDNEGNMVMQFVLYGGVFINDVYNDKLYRTKYTKDDIIEAISTLE